MSVALRPCLRTPTASSHRSARRASPPPERAASLISPTARSTPQARVRHDRRERDLDYRLNGHPATSSIQTTNASGATRWQSGASGFDSSGNISMFFRTRGTTLPTAAGRLGGVGAARIILRGEIAEAVEALAGVEIRSLNEASLGRHEDRSRYFKHPRAHQVLASIACIRAIRAAARESGASQKMRHSVDRDASVCETGTTTRVQT